MCCSLTLHCAMHDQSSNWFIEIKNGESEQKVQRLKSGWSTQNILIISSGANDLVSSHPKNLITVWLYNSRETSINSAHSMRMRDVMRLFILVSVISLICRVIWKLNEFMLRVTWVCENNSRELAGWITIQHLGKLNICVFTQLNYITSKVYYIDVKVLRFRVNGT